MADNGVLANSTIRICPGRYYADASLFINIAMILHVFDISPPLDKVPRAGTPGQFEVGSGSGFCGGQLGSGLERWGRAAEGVCFPLR